MKAHFAGVPAVKIPGRVERYIIDRRAAGAADASIRLELHALCKALRLAKLAPRAAEVREHIPPRDPSKVRQGFVSREEMERLLTFFGTKHNEHLRPLVEFAFWTGWRKREMTGLKWSAVDRQAKEIRLRAEETKNATARVLPYGSNPRLVAIIEGQRARADAIQRERSTIINHVFFKSNGQPLLCFYVAWKNACKKAGKPGLLFHDMRRSAARNMIQAGIPQHVVMKVTGHKTVEVFHRYAIVSPADLGEALGRAAEKEG